MFSNGVTCNLPFSFINITTEGFGFQQTATTNKMSSELVLLNVYDVYNFNEYTANIGLGVFHSGVEVYGIEYAYSGHKFSFTGIFETEPRNDKELGEQFKFRQSIRIGYTDLTEEGVRRAISELGKEFRGDRYHPLKNNCNHFSGVCTKMLCGKDIPPWVNRLAPWLALFSSWMPFLEQ